MAESSHFEKKNPIFKDVMRKNGMSWTPDKYARMGIYVYLYNRIKGRPTEFGLSDEDVSFRLRDFIYKNYDHLVTRFRLDQVEEIDFKDPEVKKTFLKEMDEYNQHALEFDSNMPSTLKMNEFLEAVAHSRSANFSMLHASTKEKPGVEFFDDGDPSGKYKNGYLIKVREKVRKEIKNQTRRIRRETGWAALKGVGAVGSLGLTALSVLAFTPAAAALGPVFAASIITRGIVGVVGIGFGITGLRSFGTSFAQACGKIFSMRRKRRDMIYEDGEQGKRGLKAVEHALELHRQLKKIYIDFAKMGTNGKLPTEDEFMRYVKKHFPLAYKDPRSSLGQLYKEAGYFTSSKKGGVMRGVMEFIARNEVTVTRNDQIAIERDDIYNEVFNGGTGIGKDGQITSLQKFRETLNNFVADKEVYKTMHRDYRSHERNATNALVEVYKNEIFETPFSQSKVRLTKATLGDKNISEFLKNNPNGDQTLMITNAIQFMESEAQLDKNQGFQLDDSFNASIKAQLTRQAEDMAEACTKLGVDPSDPSYADVTSIASRIQNLNVRTGAPSILNDINSSSMSEGAKNYLRRMLDHREKESRVSSDELKSALGFTGSIPAGSHQDIIFSAINSLQMSVGADQRVSFIGTHSGNSYDIDEIRALISKTAYINKIDGTMIDESTYNGLDPVDRGDYEKGTILTPEQIANVTRILEEQRDSIEIRHRNEVRESAYGVIKDGQVGIKLDEVMAKIKNFQFEDISDKDKLKEFQQYWQSDIRKANPKELSEYLTMRVKQRLEESIMEKLNDPNRYIGEGGLDMLAKDLNTITGSIYLDQSQKDRIVAKIEEMHLELAFNKEFKVMEKLILKDYYLGKNEYRDKLIRFTDLPFSAQGFSNLLGENGRSSPAVDKLRSRIGDFNTAIQLSEYLTVVAPGTQRTVDPDSGETYAILRVLLKERGDGDSSSLHKDRLINEITSLFQNVQAKEMKGLTEKGASAGSDTIINLLDDKMKSILGESNDVLSPDEKLAMLLLIKKNALTFVKAQLKKFIIDPHRGHEDEYMKSEEGSKNIARIKAVWEKLCADLDANINALKNDSNCYYMSKGLRFSSASNTLNEAVSTGKMVSYVNSATSEIGAASLGG